MKIAESLLLGLLLVSVLACNEPDASLSLGELPEVIVVKPEKVSDELVMFPPKVMQADSRGNLFFFTPDFEHSIYIVNPETNMQLHWGTLGGARDDFNQPTCASFSDDRLTLYSFNSRKMVDYSYELKEGKLLTQGERYLTLRADTLWINELRALANGYYVGYDATFSDYSYVLFDKDLKYIRRFGKPAIEGMNFKFNNVCMSVQGNKIYCGANDTGYMECFEIGDDAEIQRLWSMNLNEPYFLDDGRWDWEKNMDGFRGICCSGKYIFAVFSNNAFGAFEQETYPLEHILILNTGGIVLKNIEIEGTHIWNLCVNEDKLYVLDEDFRVLEFDIEELI